MRQKHATMRHAMCVNVNGLIATCDCRKKVEWFQLSCDSMQQSHVAQISPFTQRDFVARRMFLSHRVNAPLICMKTKTQAREALPWHSLFNSWQLCDGLMTLYNTSEVRRKMPSTINLVRRVWWFTASQVRPQASGWSALKNSCN